jgi:nicotinamide mononucleotide transporter
METSYLMAFSASPEVEWLAMLSSIIYVFLAAKGNIWCWLAGFVSCLLFTFVFLYQQVYSQIVLNILYMLMAIFGWIMWMEPRREGQPSIFVIYSFRLHLLVNVALLAAAYLLYLVVPQWFGQQTIYLEIILVLTSVFATIMTIYRVVESWIYWLVLDLLGVYLYWQGTSTTVVYFSVHSVLAIYGFMQWRRFRQQDIVSPQGAQYLT